MSYSPKPFTGETDTEFRQWVVEELDKVARSQTETPILELRPIHAPPTKPRPGMIVYADGTDWNPGAGEGPYAYSIGGTWVSLS